MYSVFYYTVVITRVDFLSYKSRLFILFSIHLSLSVSHTPLSCFVSLRIVQIHHESAHVTVALDTFWMEEKQIIEGTNRELRIGGSRPVS